jgi:hypothetical protein
MITAGQLMGGIAARPLGKEDPNLSTMPKQAQQLKKRYAPLGPDTT